MNKIDTAINLARTLQNLLNDIVSEDTLGNDGAKGIDNCAVDMNIVIDNLKSYQYALENREGV